jgi:uncharacterized membrane protein
MSHQRTSGEARSEKASGKGRGGSGEVLNVRRRMAERHGPGREAVVRVGRVLSRPAFFFALLALHLAWVIANLPALADWLPWSPWDPPPFVLLATIASVEAPFIALLVLMRQEHDRRIAELREETALQVDFHSEREATAQLRLLVAIAQRLGIERFGELARREGEPPLDLDALQRTLDPERLVEETREQIEESGEEAP